MSKLYLEIFNSQRKRVFEKLADFKEGGVLGGGTAIALQVGGRYSYDFDVFFLKPLKKDFLGSVVKVFGEEIEKIIDLRSELSFLTPGKVKVSFIHFPFKPLYATIKTKRLPLFDLRDLASNKAYVIGRRGEYRDYVDLFFLLKSGLSLKKIIREASKRFKGAFSERLFLEQLVYFDDLKDFRVDFLKEKYSVGEIKAFFQSEVEKFSKG